jgi:hypothetical protein
MWRGLMRDWEGYRRGCRGYIWGVERRRAVEWIEPGYWDPWD